VFDQFHLSQFQFLIGTIKTPDQRISLGTGAGVSIPYRYDKNYNRNLIIEYIFRFQFLIGTIKTTYADCSLPGSIAFQFLIGTIKTLGDLRTGQLIGSFNSL